MASNSEFQVIGHQGWLGGFSNIFAKENYRWWRTRQWLMQTLVWLAVVNGILAGMVWSKPNFPDYMDEATRQAILEQLPMTTLDTFINILGMATAVGAVILAQDALIKEKNSGTAAWVMSKPASRAAFVLAKITANSLGILVTMVIIQAVVGYMQIWLGTGRALPVPEFAGAMGLVFLGLLFYFTLAIMLGSMSNSRGLVIGIPLLVNLGYQFFLMIGTWLGDIMPWNLVVPLGDRPSLAMALIQGIPLPTITPIIATVLWSILFTVVALWSFSREEF
jgi:ABC-2 type transport system permease protein